MSHLIHVWQQWHTRRSTIKTKTIGVNKFILEVNSYVQMQQIVICVQTFWPRSVQIIRFSGICVHTFLKEKFHCESDHMMDFFFHMCMRVSFLCVVYLHHVSWMEYTFTIIVQRLAFTISVCLCVCACCCCWYFHLHKHTQTHSQTPLLCIRSTSVSSNSKAAPHVTVHVAHLQLDRLPQYRSLLF